MLSITDEHFYTFICLLELLITEMYPLDIKIEYSCFLKLTIYFFEGVSGDLFPGVTMNLKKLSKK